MIFGAIVWACAEFYQKRWIEGLAWVGVALYVAGDL